MRIGFYLDEWREGGVPVFLDRLEQQLTAAGHEVVLFLARPFPRREKGPEELYRALKKRLGPRCVSLHLFSFPPEWRGAHFREVLFSSRLDCLLINQFASELSLMKSISRDLPLVTIAHTDSDYYYHEFMRMQGHARGSIAVSRTIQRKCLLWASPEEASRLYYLPYGVPPGEPNDDIAEDEPLRVVYVARLDPLQKRCQDLVPIWTDYLQRGGQGRLTIVGSGQGEESLRAAFLEGTPTRGVSLVEHVSSDDALALIARGDVLLNISNFEGLPQTVLEGARLGLYPLLSDIESGHREIVETLGTGTLCHAGDTRAFATELLRLEAKLPALRAQRRSIREVAGNHYSLELCGRRYEKLFEKVRSDQQRPAFSPQKYRPSLKERFGRIARLIKYRRHYPGSADE